MAIQKNKDNILTNLEVSIQISLSGLSFCVLNSKTNTIEHLKHFPSQNTLTPFTLLDALKHVFNTEAVLNQSFKTVQLIHVNALSTFVPKALFNEDCKADYLKFNAKILSTDFIAYDMLNINDSVNVYVPYVNINNFIFDHFGDFTYKHHSTVLVETILKQEKNTLTTKIHVNCSENHFEIVATKSGKLVLYNSFEINSKEDFIYYILFTIEQLNLNPETADIILLGNINKDDDYYKIAYKYIRNVSFGNRYDTFTYTEAPKTNYSDFTLLKSL
ncbi:DUF3822 family protein [Lacinutrix salivirga]